MQNLQEAVYGKEYDYRASSPHLRHWKLYDELVSQVRSTVDALLQRGMPMTVLEIGAGHGAYTEVVLAAGCRVTATEMSSASLQRLRAKFASNTNFTPLLDTDGSLSVLGGERFSLILATSVLHHIPDYQGFVSSAIDRHLLPGGSLLTLQDPLWYPTLPRRVRYIERLAYLSWRMFRGNLRMGLRTTIRRLRGVYDEQNPSDMVEYHVVRQGVNHVSLMMELTPMFAECSLIRYWSTQAPLWQAVGDLCGFENTFAIRAEDRKERVRPSGTRALPNVPEPS